MKMTITLEEARAIQARREAHWARREAEVTPADRALASLLMTVAFDGNPDAERVNGMAPVYLEQAFHLNRSFREELLKLLR